MKRNVPTPQQLEAATCARVFWTYSLDYRGNLCRSLININSLTSRLEYAPMDLPIHQTCEIRDHGQRIL